MLELRRIVKDYKTGDTRVRALNSINLCFRKNEFVSILGPSGCGKTTLLNIIGGLDQYTSGNLIIRGVSTKEYTDADWDSYRNHSIGFVFQSYNLIPHQTVLANVELALTLSGISPTERRSRAIRALRDVGLAAHVYKKPSQLSGGQMQRVAIARALVNNPDIILADEPTGALDTVTSVQIMEILKKISRRKLIIMVTHNPELAKEYSSRIISMVDGRITDDTNPCWGVGSFHDFGLNSDGTRKRKRRNPFSINAHDVEKFKLGGTGISSPRMGKRKRSMSFFTALSLSLNNLMTKKARTFMVSFAGSIGIIGIALILSVSTGVNNYINAVQRDTLASYPIQLVAESTDLTSLITTMMQTSEEKELDRELNKVYESTIIVDLMNSLNSADTNKNDLKAFKAHLESTEAFKEYLTAIQYEYDFNWSVLVKDTAGGILKSDVMELINAIYGGGMSNSAAGSMMGGFGGMGSSMASSFNVWQEMLPGVDADEPINSIIKDEYDVIYGHWPTAYNEVVLVVNKQNEISDLALYALGLRTEKEIMEALMSSSKGEIVDTSQAKSWSYEELCGMTFRLFLQSECYQKQLDGTYQNISDTDAGLAFLYDNEKLGIDLKITGIIRPGENTTSSILSGTIAYTSKLTEYAIEKTATSELIQAQITSPETDILTGKPFKADNFVELTPAEKKEAVLAAMAQMDEATKLAFFMQLVDTPTEGQITQAFEAQVTQFGGLRPFAIFALQMQGMTPEDAAAAIANIDDDMLRYTFYQSFKETYTQQYADQMQAMLQGMTPEQMMAMMNQKLAELTDEEFADLYDEYLDNYSDSTYEKNLSLLGNVSLDSPSAINLYCDTFEDKDFIASLITEYNKTVPEEKQINYTDYVALLMSSVTTIVDAITYVLIAFVAISLVVSSIMIGIITYISVLERTKEIGILRAIGASKKDIRRVFNAETLIVGFVAGALGIGITLGLNIVINIILFKLTGIATLKAVLPTAAAFLLVGISMALTLIAGIFPSGFAARRNPVEALRTE
ncbi:MAG: ABC transporter ATP-binding protein/permease [Clostridia bacterium]|nr:ABC transporter ATP-binding protein/permease [Clostridia bacterium]